MRKFLALITVLTCVFAPTLALAQAASPYPFVHSGTLQNAAAALGNGTTFDSSRLSTVVFVGVSTSGTTTLTFEGSLDNTNWFTLAGCYVMGATTAGSTMSVTSTPAATRCNVTAITSVRARISTCTTCVGVTVKAYGSSVPLSSTLN